MNEKVFNGDMDRLRAPDRMERYEVSRVVELCLAGGDIHSVLDIGTGTGLFAEAFMKAGVKVTGIDINPAMLEQARRLVPAEFIQAPAEKLPFEDNAFDLIFFGCVLHEVDDLEQTLRECRRVARVRVVAEDFEYKIQDFGPPLEHRLKEKEVRTAARAAGFSHVETTQLSNLMLYIFDPAPR